MCQQTIFTLCVRHVVFSILFWVIKKKMLVSSFKLDIPEHSSGGPDSWAGQHLPGGGKGASVGFNPGELAELPGRATPSLALPALPQSSWP